MTAYATGTITLTNGSRAVTGDGTGWTTALIAGGVIYPQAAGNPLPIASVDSDTAITAATEWVGASGTYAYALQRQDDANQVIANAAALADYIRRLDDPALSALSGLTPAADTLAYFNGAGSAAITTLTSFARSLLDDANASNALATLGVSTFAKTLLGDADASEARQTLGTEPETPGRVAFFARSSAPTGWLKANGAAVSRAIYSGLYSAIGTTFGAGDGATTFNLPDLRGEFLRSLDDGRGIDSGRTLGSFQGSQMQSHTHNWSGPRRYLAGGAYPWVVDGGANFAAENGTTSAAGGTSNGSENRPRNIALLACIKY